ncbi:MAG: hypothetical protein IJC74_06880 [Clostridia bacterium]|nr:hypothetical protein [Clostridia bacterium]
MIKTKVIAFLTSIAIFTISVACLVQAAEVDAELKYNFEYAADEVYYDFEFNDNTELSKYGCTVYDTYLPEIKTDDGEGVAFFDLSRLAQKGRGRIGFKIPNNNEQAEKLKKGLESGTVIYEFKAKVSGRTDVNFFYPLFSITNKIPRLSKSENYTDSISEDEWHTFSVMLDYREGTVNVVNVMIDGVILDINKTDSINDISAVTSENAMTVFMMKMTGGVYEGTMSLDYLRVYKPCDYDDLLLFKRFRSNLAKEYKSYSNFDAEWLQKISDKGEFSDLTYTFENGADENAKKAVYADRAEHIYRVKGMAAEYSQKDRALYKNVDLFMKIQKAAEFYVKSEFDMVGISGNWSNTLECPKVLADVFLMLKEIDCELPENLIDICKEHYFDLHSRAGYENNNAYEFAMNTSNLPVTCHLWKTLTVLLNDFTYAHKIYDALSVTLTGHVDENGNGVMADEAKSNVPDTVLGTNYFGDGFYPDGSYYGHGPLHYNWGYGFQYLRGTKLYVELAAGTKYQFSKEKLSILVDLLLDSMRWTVRGDNIDFASIGRSADSPDENGKVTNSARGYITEVLSSLLKEPCIPRKNELIKLKDDVAKDLLINKNGNTSTNYVSGNKHFWQTDLMAHQRNGYSAILKMSGIRTLRAERVGDDGNNTYYMGAGTLPVMITGHEYEKAIAVWDWDRLPGITALNKDEDVPEQTDLSHIPNRHYGSHSFVGGVSNGSYGAAAMDYSDNLKTKTAEEYINPSVAVVNAKKAWFFFDDEIVALGADVSSTDEQYNLLTNLNQCISDGEVTYCDESGRYILEASESLTSQNIKWVHHAQTGYVFPEKQNVTVLNKAQTGNGRRKDDKSYPYYTENIFSLYLDHGINKGDGEYSYIIVPGKTAEELSDYTNNNPVQIIHNNKNIQAVYHKNLNIVQAVFRTEGSLKINNYEITTNKPCILMADFSGADIKIYVQNPENKKADISVSVKFGDITVNDLVFSTKDGIMAGETVFKSSEKLSAFRTSDNKKAENYSQITHICLENDIIKNGAYVIVAYYNSENLMVDINAFDIKENNLNDIYFLQKLKKTDKAVDMKLFVFKNSESIKPLMESVLFSDTINVTGGY